MMMTSCGILGSITHHGISPKIPTVKELFFCFILFFFPTKQPKQSTATFRAFGNIHRFCRVVSLVAEAVVYPEEVEGRVVAEEAVDHDVLQ